VTSILARWLAPTVLWLSAGAISAAPNLPTGEAARLADSAADGPDQILPRSAYGGGTYLIVWQQGRNYYQGPTADIYARRVDASGKPLDAGPLPLCTKGDSQEQPAVAFNLKQFLIVWQDFRNGRDWDVYGARVTADGKILDPDGFLIADGPHSQALPAVAPADEGFLVIWQDFSDGRFYRIRHAVVSSDGKVSRSTPLAYTGPPKPELWGYMPGWGVQRQPLTAGGDTRPILSGGGAVITRLATGWLLSWNDDSNWTPGAERNKITRRFGWLQRRGKELSVTDIQRAPAMALGKEAGHFASDGKNIALYTGVPITRRGNRFAAAALFAGNGAVALPDPNQTNAQGKQRWRTRDTIELFTPAVPVDAPLAAAYADGLFLVAARGSVRASKTSLSNRIFGARLLRQGKYLDGAGQWAMLHKGQRLVANPTLAGGDRGFLLVFQEQDEHGRQRLWAKTIKAKP